MRGGREERRMDDAKREREGKEGRKGGRREEGRGEGRVFKMGSTACWNRASPRSTITALSLHSSFPWGPRHLENTSASHFPDVELCREVRSSATPPFPGPVTMDLSPVPLSRAVALAPPLGRLEGSGVETSPVQRNVLP